MFSHRRQRRFWAGLMLLVWLMGVTVGVAQACVPSSSQPSDLKGPAARHPSAHCQQAAGVAADAASTLAAEQRDSADPPPYGKTHCQDRCEKSVLSVPPPSKLLDPGVAGCLVPGSLTLPEPPTRSAPTAQGMRQADEIAGPSITILFLRLAL
jgi:hypothetical protein